MATKATIYLHPQPINVDAEINKIQVKLSTIDWMEACYGRAWKQILSGKEERVRNFQKNLTSLTDGSIIRPLAYQGKSQYFDCLPNDMLKSFSFFVVNDAVQPMDYQAFIKGTYTYNVDLIVWFNQKKTHPSIDYPLHENLCQDVKKSLRNIPSVIVNKIFFEPKKVYEQFSIDLKEQQQAMFPYGCFRINMDISVLEIDSFGGC